MKNDRSITVLNFENSLALVSRSNCSTLMEKIEPLTFAFDEIVVTIQPETILETIKGHSGKEYCRIML